MSTHLRNKARKILVDYFSDNELASKVHSMIEDSIVVNKIFEYRTRKMLSRYILRESKMGGMPLINYTKHGLHLVNDQVKFPIFIIEDKKMDFICQFATYYEKKIGMVCVFIEHQDAQSYEESCPACKVIYEPDVESTEFLNSIDLSQNSIDMYNTGYFYKGPLSKITLPDYELILQTYPESFTREMLSDYREKVLNKFDATLESIIYRGNPIALQGYPVPKNSIHFLQIPDPRDISGDPYIYYLYIDRDSFQKRDFSGVKFAIGQST